MFRLFFFGFILIVGIVASVLSLFLIFAIIRWVKQLFSASSQFVNDQHKDWQAKQYDKEAEKNMPGFLVEGKKRLQHINQQSDLLNEKWQLLLRPVIDDSQFLLNTAIDKPEQAQAARSFFTVTLKTLDGFTEALVDMKGVMQNDEEEKAKQNIEVFMTDIYKYRAKIESKKRFDFHVMMEVIKQRLGK